MWAVLNKWGEPQVQSKAVYFPEVGVQGHDDNVVYLRTFTQLISDRIKSLFLI